ncbi:MAG: glycosyltransferase family 2 protein [Verrucomicrobiota bacterium]
MLKPDADRSPDQRLVSVIIPCLNEEDNISDSLEEIVGVLESKGEAFELLPVNDGSKDGTLERIKTKARDDDRVVPIDLIRNYGQTRAYQAGIDAARGTHVILFSGDLEIPAEEILKVIEELDSGYDFVNTSRKDRWGASHALKSRLANGLLNRLNDLKICDRGSGLKGMKREIAKSFRLYGEWHRFLPDLASIHTSRITEFEVPFAERKAGVSSYKGKLKSLSVFLDLASVAFTVHSHRKPYLMLPGRLLGFTGLLIGAIGIATTAYLVYLKLFMGEALADRPLFLVAVLLSVLGLNMVMIGILGELIMQISAKLDHHIVRYKRPS